MRFLRLAALAVGALCALAACRGDASGGAGEHSSHAPGSMPVAPASVLGAPVAPVAGPQGRVPQFVVRCALSHVLPDDPIVYPGQAGASHLHVFFGNRAADADATYSSMLGAETSCEQRRDTAAYWAPALLRDGRLVPPSHAIAYYRPGQGVDPETVQAYPPDLRMIAGDPTATAPQPLSVVAWSCGSGSERSVDPPACPEQRGLRLNVTFPDCWDGRHLDVDGHRDHLRYSGPNGCPATHPVPLPQLTLAVAYPLSGDPSGLALTSGGVWSGHADFVNTWDQDKLETEVRSCLHRRVVCGVTSG